jgi:hypothetical protein
MQVITLKDRSVNWHLTPQKYPIKNEGSRSKFQHQIYLELKELYSHDIILEEVKVPDNRLFFDFVIPAVRLVIECQGKQHYEFNTRFHKYLEDFIRQQNRDQLKRDFCQINNLTLVEVPYDRKRTTAEFISEAQRRSD